MEISTLIAGILMILTGILSLTVVILNSEWFFRNRNVVYFVHCFGRTGTRFFYGMLGCGMVGMGVTMVYSLF